jgi:hypothetical protein
MHTLTLNIQDSLLDKVLDFLQNLPENKIHIIENRAIEDFDYWSEKEINDIGKIGFHSNSFEEDNEDYSKW